MLHGLLFTQVKGSLDEEGYEAAKDNAISKFDAIDRLVNEYAPDQIELALSSDDVRRIHRKRQKSSYDRCGECLSNGS